MTPVPIDLMPQVSAEPIAPVASSNERGASAGSFRDALEQARRREASDVDSKRERAATERADETTQFDRNERAEAKADNAPSSNGKPPQAADGKPRAEQDDAITSREGKPEESAGDNDADDAETDPVVEPIALAAAVAVEPQTLDTVTISTETTVAEVAVEASPPQPKRPELPAASAPTFLSPKNVAPAESSEAGNALESPVKRDTALREVERPIASEQPNELLPTAAAKTPNSADAVEPRLTMPTAEAVESVAAVPQVVVEPKLEEQETIRDRAPRPIDQLESQLPTPLQTPATSPAAQVPVFPTPAVSVGDAATGDANASTSGNQGDSAAGVDRAPPEMSRSDTAEPRDLRPASTQSHAGAQTASFAAGDSSPTSLTQADRVRFIQRVARALQTAPDRGGELKLRLSPPELGSLRLHVQMREGALSARIEAETAQARQLLTDNLAVLRERLAEQNIRVDRFDVDLFQSSGGGAPNLPDRRQDAAHDGSARRGRVGVANEQPRESTAPKASSGSPSGGLNVVV